MSDIFISYTSTDRDWAAWIAKELKALGHTPHVHEWEIKGGDDIYAWMEKRHDAADHVLCVVSDEYLKAPYSTLERNAAIWQTANQRPGFVLFVVVKPCRFPTLIDHFRRCELYSAVSDDERHARFHEFMTKKEPADRIVLPTYAVSNIPIRVPTHFMGRDDSFASIEQALGRYRGRVAVTVLHGLRGVGKTTLAAAYADCHRNNYRATWWIRAQTESTVRADLVALGVRLGWVAADDKEEPALAAVKERLRHEGESVLLIFDNATDADGLKPHLPAGGAARVLVTSNAPAWRGVGEPIEIGLWPKAIGANYLIARTARSAEGAAAEELSDTLAGLPLALEQAAAYCERLAIPLAEYRRRFEVTPARMLDAARDAPAEYHDRLTVAKTFGLAIDEAAKLHRAAEPLIAHAALLAPDAIPLFVFSEARAQFSEPFAADLADDGVDEALAALRSFALVDRETIADERDPTITTECIRLHRLVRTIVQETRLGDLRQDMLRALLRAVAAVFPENAYREPKVWPRCAALLTHALFLRQIFGKQADPPKEYVDLVDKTGAYLHGRGAYSEAEPLLREAVSICEKRAGNGHSNLGIRLNDLAILVRQTGRLEEAERLYRQSLASTEQAYGLDDPKVAITLSNLANLLRQTSRHMEAEPLLRRALAIQEKTLGPDDPKIGVTLNNLGNLLHDVGRYAEAEALFRKAIDILQSALGREHPNVIVPINNLVDLLRKTGRSAEAEPLAREVLAISEKTLGRAHPEVAVQLNNLGNVLRQIGRTEEAEQLLREAVANNQTALGRRHPDVAVWLNNLANLLRESGRISEAESLYREAIEIGENAYGRSHPSVARRLNNLANLLSSAGRHSDAEPLYREALATWSKYFDENHPDLIRGSLDLASLLINTGRAEEALHSVEPVLERCKTAFGAGNALTEEAAKIRADALIALGGENDMQKS